MRNSLFGLFKGRSAWLVALALAGTICVPCLPAQEQAKGTTAYPKDGKVLITLKIVKRAGTANPLDYKIAPIASCPTCEILSDPTYVSQNAREINFALRVPRGKAVPVTIEMPGTSVRRLVLEGSDLSYSANEHTVAFELPPQDTDRINSAEFHTHIVYRGLDLRFEHADPARRAGFYANGTFPALERQAAANLEFAQREAIFRLGLNTYVAEQQIGTILLMGFDTNDPHGHTDAPPHMHMHLRWPQRGGTQIGHYYIDKRGLLTANKVTITGWTEGPVKTFPPGASYTTFDLRGRPVYTHTITVEGWLDLSRPGGGRCEIRPVSPAAGFDQGAKVTCPGFPVELVSVNDNTVAGLLQVSINGRTEKYHYDPDVGTLLP